MDLLLPPKERSKVFKLTEHNKKAIKAWKRYERIKKRYIVYKVKPPKIRTIDLLKSPILLTSDKQIKKYRLEKFLPKKDEPEISEGPIMGDLYKS